jgi:riboflavin kinase/FMN adenylyltransferase
MQIHRDIANLPSFHRPVLTIGSFDGVHRGHQTIIKILNERAAQQNGESVLITFEPHPRLIVEHKDPFYILSTLAEKIYLLRDSALDHIIVVPFDHTFSSQSPENYLEHFIYQSFQPVEIVIGYDHRYGTGRTGDLRFMQQYFSGRDIKITEVDPVLIQDIAISSSAIRRALNNGDLHTAYDLAGHPYLIKGNVVQGDRIGRTLGYPTANIQVNTKIKLLPPDGVYAVCTEYKGHKYYGMAYIGDRPVIGTGLTKVFEVNIFDFDKDTYGEEVNVWLYSYIRPDKSLTSLAELKNQLAIDKDAVIQYFNNSDITV